MDIFQIVILGITASLILLILRRERPELALVLSMAAGAAILVAVLPGLRMVITAFSDIAREAGVGPLYFGIILKVVAIAYIADLGSFNMPGCR